VSSQVRAPLARSDGIATLWLASEKLGQLGDIHSNFLRLILAEQLGCRASARWSSNRHTVVWPSACLSIALVPSSLVVRYLTARCGRRI
jgi:hypothetical protein